MRYFRVWKPGSPKPNAVCKISFSHFVKSRQVPNLKIWKLFSENWPCTGHFSLFNFNFCRERLAMDEQLRRLSLLKLMEVRRISSEKSRSSADNIFCSTPEEIIDVSLSSSGFV